MNKPFHITRPTHFDLGFAQGSDAADDPSDLEMSSRVPEYRLGYVIGRGYSEAVKQANRDAGIVTASQLAARYKVQIEALLKAMGLLPEYEHLIRSTYTEVIKS